MKILCRYVMSSKKSDVSGLTLQRDYSFVSITGALDFEFGDLWTMVDTRNLFHFPLLASAFVKKLLDFPVLFSI